jgi:hypothetical protein
MHASASNHFGLCRYCGRPLRHAVACPLCGRSCCRWQCYTQHVDWHRRAEERRPAPRRATGLMQPSGAPSFTDIERTVAWRRPVAVAG